MEKISLNNLIDAAVGYGKNRPVAMLSFAFNYYFGKYNVVGYHLVNILVHITTGILLFIFLKLTLTISSQQPGIDRKYNPIAVTGISFVIAMLWLVHPIQTQSVTYIVQRMSSMGAMFYLLALILYAKGRLAQRRTLTGTENRPQKSGPRGYIKNYYFCYVGCILAGLLALSSKESTASRARLAFLSPRATTIGE